MKDKIWNLINDAKTILLLTHESPDGDAIGSSMAFYYMLTSINKTVDIVIPKVPETFLFLKDINKISNTSDNYYDLVIVLDCATKTRIGQINNEFSRCKNSIVIDHHISNTGYADLNYVEGDSAACCQVLYYLFKYWKVKIDKNIGTALSSGLLTDTNGFRNDNVSKETFLMAADMIKYNVNIHQLYRKVLSLKSMAKFKLTKIAMDNLKFYADGKIAFSYITKDDFDRTGAIYGDHEGLVDIGRNIDGVEASVFMREDESGFRVSIRSNGLVDANEIAKKFDGGGHHMAAGIKFSNSDKDTINLIIDEIKKALEV